MGNFFLRTKPMNTFDTSIIERLNDNPDLKEFVVSSLELVDSTEITADEAEEILLNRIREYGPKLLGEWAKKNSIKR